MVRTQVELDEIQQALILSLEPFGAGYLTDTTRRPQAREVLGSAGMDGVACQPTQSENDLMVLNHPTFNPKWGRFQIALWIYALCSAKEKLVGFLRAARTAVLDERVDRVIAVVDHEMLIYIEVCKPKRTFGL